MERAQSLEIGYLVALGLQPGAAPLRCYVGQIEAIDDRGIRLTLIDWFTGMFAGYDFYTPWESVTSALVCTPAHDAKRFGEEAAEYQADMKPKSDEKLDE